MNAVTDPSVPPIPPAKVAHTPQSERVQSVDVLRGMDMLCICGGDNFFHALALATAWGWAVKVSNQFAHSVWYGCTLYDTIWPVFLFIVGITMSLSIRRRLERGQSQGEIFKRLLIRAILLVILGQLDKNGPISLDYSHIRFAGVLQRIGIAGLAAGVIMMYARPRARVLWIIGILVGYWALLTFVPAPGQPKPTFASGVNIVDYLDQHYMPGRFALHDDCGWFSTPPVVASILLGSLASCWLFSGAALGRKVLGLVAGGIGLILLGWLWSFQMPLMKHIWSSSYVLFTAGWGSLIFGSVYWIVDGLGWRRWTFPFILIGMNPLFIYLALRTGLLNFAYITKFFLGFTFAHVPALMGPLCQVVATILVELAFLYWLYRRKLFWRV